MSTRASRWHGEKARGLATAKQEVALGRASAGLPVGARLRTTLPLVGWTAAGPEQCWATSRPGEFLLFFFCSIFYFCNLF